MTADTMPQLQVFEKLRQIPLVEIAYNTSAGVYKRVKDCNGLVHWTLNGAEGAFQIALGAVTPVAVKLQQPINLVDDTLCKGIDVLQEKVPIVKEPPGQIYESAKSYVSNSAAAGKVQSITTKSWEKANEVLSSSYGNMALNGLDSTSTIADKYIDYYLPAEEDEENIHPHPNSECEDKVLHTVHTVGTLSAKVSRRVYRTLSGTRKRQERNDGQNPQDTNNTEMGTTSSQNTENLTHRKPSSDSDQYS
uniref:Putative lipid storage droplets surface binding protein 2 n=1 Tax=Panstrongylus lignarius TaxID=156445 RepID=A0A224XIN1_9HEMI